MRDGLEQGEWRERRDCRSLFMEMLQPLEGEEEAAREVGGGAGESLAPGAEVALVTEPNLLEKWLSSLALATSSTVV